MKFVDLFAGLGGFHLALKQLGHECVFASEISDRLRETYTANFGLEPRGDIREIALADIPAHDILCGGFPCQPFSKAGGQQGLRCPKNGDLFERTLAILRHRKPLYLILENVPNLERHDSGRTWQSMQRGLREAGYHVRDRKLSPHKFGIPQIRERIFIVGSREPINGFVWPHEAPSAPLSIVSALEQDPTDARPLTTQVVKCLEVWQDFVAAYPCDKQLPSFPIWSMEFGADYPYEHDTPHSIGVARLRKFHGSHGVPLQDLPDEAVMASLPAYARTKEAQFPAWKVQFIKQNRTLYHSNIGWISQWHPKVLAFPASLQKLEWNCKGEVRDIWRYIIQFRASGVRVKRPATSPSLIAMTATQVPIIGWQRRYLTPRECAKLQSMSELPYLPTGQNAAFNALGNAVNVELVKLIAERLVARDRTGTGRTALGAHGCACEPELVASPSLGAVTP